jgi:D-alanine-D-alanine ligase
MSKKIIVAMIFGGRSPEHEISLISASAIHRNLDRAKFEVRPIYITKDGLWKSVEAPSLDIKALARGRAFSFLPWQARDLRWKVPADIYFPVLHGRFGEDGTIQGLLEMADVPYVGAGVLGSALAMDKAAAKSLFKERGIPVVPWTVVREEEWHVHKQGILRRINEEFGLPFFVKPANLGSSVGITKVKDFRQAGAALETAFRYDAKILVEKGISGREIECSVLGNEAPEASLPGEVIPFREFYDYNDKYIDGKTHFVIPAGLSRPSTERVRRLAVEAFKALECSGLARVDFFLEGRTLRLYVNEVNTIPGFTEISMYPKLWEASGLPFPRLVERLIALGFERHRARKTCLDRGC